MDQQQLFKKNGNGPNGGNNENEPFIVAVVDFFHDKNAKQKPDQYCRNQSQVYKQSFCGDGFPDKDVKGKFEQICNEKEPCGSSNKFVFR